ncbi:MAG: 4a-hydroxytetrahydrobiopterin dehydratase [Nocardioides sp.]|uniref:4a-hydroxytetrahydrobiopterin dehydratase n=1 Tax=Nocardioides sp. TaxID=35761 RepID=UPI003F06C274
MDDPKRTLTHTEVQAAGLGDWRQILHTLHAVYATGDFAGGLRLVNLVGKAAETANHHPDVSLSYGEVRLRLSSHDVGGLTSRDLALAQEISDLAHGLGMTPAPERITVLELGLDVAAGHDLGAAYAALLGGRPADGEVVDPAGALPSVWFQDADPSYVPEVGEPEQRWHLDVWVPEDQVEARIAAFVEAGGRLVDDSHAPSFWVLADAAGNRSCVCAVTARD